MGTIFKMISGLTALATTGLLTFESVRRGSLVLGTLLGLIKLFILGAFIILLVFIVYLLLTPVSPKAETPPE